MTILSLPSIDCLHPVKNCRARLICFHHAGAGVSIFRTWPQFMPSFVEIYAAQLPGHERQHGSKPYRNLSDLVNSLADVIDTASNIPFAFYGHSMGAWVSFELARVMKKRYNIEPIQLFVSGAKSPNLPPDLPLMHSLPTSEFVEELKKLNGIPNHILENDDFMAYVLPILRADFEVCETYQYHSGELLSCPITVYCGDLDTITMSDLIPWRNQTTGKCLVHIMPGDHFFIRSPESNFLNKFSEDISNTLASLQ